VGHAGTLDPLAGGVLVVLLGKATGLSTYATSTRKTYAAEIVLGAATTTDDAEGAICREAAVPDISEAELGNVLTGFVGEIDQIPPRYSAIKHEGERAYKQSRAGRNISLAPRRVTIHSVRLERWMSPRLRVTIETGAGTYIRSLARDCGERLKTAGYLHALVRVQSGTFSIRDAVPLETLTENGIIRYLQSADSIVRSLPALVLNDADTLRSRHGSTLALEERPGAQATEAGAVARIYGASGSFVGLARATAAGWHPFKVLEPLS
jgi:tRNA pseudouridine55 synthase